MEIHQLHSILHAKIDLCRKHGYNPTGIKMNPALIEMLKDDMKSNVVGYTPATGKSRYRGLEITPDKTLDDNTIIIV